MSRKAFELLSGDGAVGDQSSQSVLDALLGPRCHWIVRSQQGCPVVRMRKGETNCLPTTLFSLVALTFPTHTLKTGIQSVAQAGLEISILLPQPLECWDYGCGLLCPAPI